jgi:hypothetical protein
MVRKGKVLNVIVQTVAQVVAHVSGNPFREVMVAQVQGCREKPHPQQKKRRADAE